MRYEQDIYSNRRTHRDTRGFTLVEILIVVIILGILAAIVIPQFSNASQSARAATLKEDLRFMRSQAESYSMFHNDVSPAYDTVDRNGPASEASFVAHMTMYTDLEGNTNPTESAQFKYSPFLAKVPPNPINNLQSILVIQNGQAFPAAPDNAYGWIYQPQTQTFKSDAIGTDASGADYFSY